MLFFFFQAEDGIRDDLVTGVQTCALPICCPGAGTTQKHDQQKGNHVAQTQRLGNLHRVAVYRTVRAGRRSQPVKASDYLQQQEDQHDKQDQAESAAAIVSPTGTRAITAISESENENDEDD